MSLHSCSCITVGNSPNIQLRLASCSAISRRESLRPTVTGSLVKKQSCPGESAQQRIERTCSGLLASHRHAGLRH